MSHLLDMVASTISATIHGQYHYWQYAGRPDICSRYLRRHVGGVQSCPYDEYELTIMGSNVFLRRMPDHFGHMFNASDPEFLTQIKEAVDREEFLTDDWPMASSVFGVKW